MCGIAGIYAYHHAANAPDIDELIRIRDHMTARGPDGEGVWRSEDGRIALGHRRLSIIDLSSRAAQPMISTNRKYVITFNGEIYNYRALREELEKKGYVFQTQSDTEVLLHLYADRGEAMVNDLRGMFAFGIWDTERQALFLARDSYGIKPLYYADDGKVLRFASQVKALLAGGKVSRDPEPAGWTGFYLFGNVPEPFTTFKNIRAVPSGAVLWIEKNNSHEPKTYTSIANVYASVKTDFSSLDDEEKQGQVREALLDSVCHHLVADVPVGAFLSAGVDSGALIGLMRDAGQQEIKTVTLAFEEFRGKHDDEPPLAKEIAERYETQHFVRTVTNDEFQKEIPRIMEAMDQPSIDGVNTWFVSKAARELDLKVAISGLGGDELFGGYSSFRDIPLWVRIFSLPSNIPLIGDLFRFLVSMAGPMFPGINPKTAGLLKYGGSYPGAYLLKRGLFMPWELKDVMDTEMIQSGLRRLDPMRHIAERLHPFPDSSFAAVATLESSLYMRNQLLRDADWAGMAHSLEIRVPLVDAKLLEQVSRMSPFSNGEGKRLLGKSPSKPLPDNILARKKTGFSTPIANWLQRDKRMQAWKNKPTLTLPQCPWARRWAYSVATR